MENNASMAQINTAVQDLVDKFLKGGNVDESDFVEIARRKYLEEHPAAYPDGGACERYAKTFGKSYQILFEKKLLALEEKERALPVTTPEPMPSVTAEQPASPVSVEQPAHPTHVEQPTRTVSVDAVTHTVSAQPPTHTVSTQQPAITTSVEESAHTVSIEQPTVPFSAYRPIIDPPHKINYIYQMNGFLARRKRDELGPAPTTVYMVLFEKMNRLRWSSKFVRIGTRTLLKETGIGGSQTLDAARQLLRAKGYIDYRIMPQGSNSYTEYTLIPMDAKGFFLTKPLPQPPKQNTQNIAKLNNIIAGSIKTIDDEPVA